MDDTPGWPVTDNITNGSPRSIPKSIVASIFHDVVGGFRLTAERPFPERLRMQSKLGSTVP